MPDVVKKVLKEEGKKTRKLDPEFHIWVGPRIIVNASYPKGSIQREEHAESIIQEAIVRFADFHPNHIKFVDAPAAAGYFGALRKLISKKTYDVSVALEQARGPLSSGNELTHKFIGTSMDRMFGKRLYVRAHDLWANDDSVRDALIKDYPDWFSKKLEELGEEEAFRKRVALLEEFRRRRFAKLDKTEQDKWIALAKKPAPKDFVDQASFVIQWLPVINIMLKWFSDESGAPVLLLTGSLSLANPGFAEIYA